MTIALSIKVHDGIVLAADSATTLVTHIGGQLQVANVYNNANKVFNLYKGLPIGAMTWGAGSIGRASMSTLAKDLRRRFMGGDPNHQAWKLNHENYTIEDVAKQARKFLYEELYTPLYQNEPQKPSFGFVIAGYSSGKDLPEEWLIQVLNGTSPDPTPIIQVHEDSGMFWQGEPEAITRLVFGIGTRLPEVLKSLGVPDAQIGPGIEQIKGALQAQLVFPAMPIQDVIDLAAFLVQTTIMYSRFSPGAPTVGGPIEIAAITKHEGFKWVQRKYYFDTRINPAPEG